MTRILLQYVLPLLLPAAVFLVWVMLVVGGSGNNRGAILGAFVIWTLWSTTEIDTARFSGEWAVRVPVLRVCLGGLGVGGLPAILQAAGTRYGLRRPLTW